MKNACCCVSSLKNYFASEVAGNETTLKKRTYEVPVKAQPNITTKFCFRNFLYFQIFFPPNFLKIFLFLNQNIFPPIILKSNFQTIRRLVFMQTFAF